MLAILSCLSLYFILVAICNKYMIKSMLVFNGLRYISPFSEDEYRKGVATLKNNKAAGRDDVWVEQLKNLGPNAHKWLRAMLNNCFIDNKILTIWRQSKIIAILKTKERFSNSEELPTYIALVPDVQTL